MPGTPLACDTGMPRAALLICLCACDGLVSALGAATPHGPDAGVDVTANLPAFEPAPFRPRLLIARQYTNTVAVLLGAEAAKAIAPPTDVAVNGMTIVGASQVTLSAQGVEQYEDNARAAARVALAKNRTSLIHCTPTSSADATCMSDVVTQFAPRAFRRPVTPDEVTRWVQLGLTAAVAFDSFDRGVEFVVAGLLQSPHFLYLDESGEPDPAAPQRRRLTAHQLANRLAYFITDAPPDDVLRSAAADGSLLAPATLETQARRLLASGTSEAAVAFFDELLGLGALPGLAKDPQAFPDFDPMVGASMREQTRRTIASVLGQNADVRDLFTTTTTFVDGQLAKLYGLPAVSQWTQVELPSRPGLLHHSAFLALRAHPAQNSPTHRGKFIRERLLCQPVSAPPANVNTTLPPPPPGTHRTLREKLALHAASASCAGCHSMMDPLGFAFEGFDALGRARLTDDTLPVDTTGNLDGTPFAGAAQLSALLHDDPRVTTCLTRTLFRQASGHVDTAGEQRPMATAHQRFSESGHRFSELVVALVTSDAFRLGRTEDAP